MNTGNMSNDEAKSKVDLLNNSNYDKIKLLEK